MRRNLISYSRNQRCADSKTEQPLAARKRVGSVTASNVVARGLCALTIVVAGTVGYASYASVADTVVQPRPAQETADFLELQVDEGVSLASEAAKSDAEQEPLAASFVLPGWAAGSVVAVLLLAGFNARKRRGHVGGVVSDDTPALTGG